MTLADKLNELNAFPEVEGGQVKLLVWTDPPTYEQDRPATDEELKALGIDPSEPGYVTDHPEGSDRGGFVPFVYAGKESAFHSENDGEWQRG